MKLPTREELDNIDARVVFSSSAGVALAIIGLLLILQPELQKLYPTLDPLIENDNCQARGFIASIILFTSSLLLFGAFLEVFRVRNPLICKLIRKLVEEQKWNAKLPSFCKKI